MNTDRTIIRYTSSLCPACLNRLPAVLERREDGVYLVKECPEHGIYSTRVWKDRIDLEAWIVREDPLDAIQQDQCSGNCRSCNSVHGQDSCCVILEVTGRCNLRCTYCFANGGARDAEPSYEELCAAISDIAVQGNGPLIQFAGGEPTLRDDLPELVRYAKEAGCRYTQINTNGIRLAEDAEYVGRLADAGLDIVFLQFDGCDDEIHRKLRGRDLLETKLLAVRNCDRYRIGVTLVPTVVRGVNDHELGNIVRKAAELFPAVRSVHFQPLTYLGRYPGAISDDHFTLDELMADLCDQTGIPEESLLPSRCDHAMCEFHSTFMVSSRRQLIPMTDRAFDTRRERTPAARNRQYVAEHWSRDCSGSEEKTDAGQTACEFAEYDPGLPLVTHDSESMDFNEFTRRMRTHTLKISAMAFQDAMNIDLERLYRCSLHVYEDGKLLPFCAKYMTPDRN